MIKIYINFNRFQLQSKRMLNSKYNKKSQKYKLSMCQLKTITKHVTNAKTQYNKKCLCDLGWLTMNSTRMSRVLRELDQKLTCIKIDKKNLIQPDQNVVDQVDSRVPTHFDSSKFNFISKF